MHIRQTTWPSEEVPLEDTVPWAQWSTTEPPQVGVRLLWTKGWKPALYFNLWNVEVSIGWFQP